MTTESTPPTENAAKQAGEIAGLKQQVSHLQDCLRAMDTATGLAVVQARGEGEQRSAMAEAVLTAAVATVGP